MKISKLKRGDIVLIKWVDSYSSARWYKEKEVKYWMKSLTECTSIGFFFKANKYSITLYNDKSPSEIGGLINIPRRVIVKIKLLK